MAVVSDSVVCSEWGHCSGDSAQISAVYMVPDHPVAS